MHIEDTCTPSTSPLSSFREDEPRSPIPTDKVKKESASRSSLCTIPYDVCRDHATKLRALYASSNEAKIWAVAAKQLPNVAPPLYSPEYTEPGGTEYVYRDRTFWTSGFFPGSLYLLLERKRRHPHLTHLIPKTEPCLSDMALHFACKWWTESLHANATLQGTHDLGFMLMPWARRAWELEGSARALSTIKTGAQTLAGRFHPTVGAIRSWDACVTQVYRYDDPGDVLVIIDNMMNLDLLFYAAAQTGDSRLYDAAVAHARTTQSSHIRADGSTVHLVVFNGTTGQATATLTNQGYSAASCWARGQAWAIAGFAETYGWTRDPLFLETACRCADYFVRRMEDLRKTSDQDALPWDFDAAALSGQPDQPPDTSAALVAAYGLLLLHDACLTQETDDRGYLAAALHLVATVCRAYLCPPAQFVAHKEIRATAEVGLAPVAARLEVDVGGIEAIVSGATINNFAHAPRRWTNHSLVYADYYFLLVGNKLLDMGLAPLILEGHDMRAQLPNGHRESQQEGH